MKKIIITFLFVLMVVHTSAQAGYLSLAYSRRSTGENLVTSYDLSGGSLVTSSTAPTGTLPSSSWSLSGLASGDYDGDGITDVYYSYNNGSVTLFSVLGGTTNFSNLASSETYGLATMDVDGDGMSEACYIGLVDGTRNAYAQRTDGTSAMLVSDTIGSSLTMYNTVGGDFNGDGVANEYGFMYQNGADYLKIMDSTGSTLQDKALVNATINTTVGVASGNFSSEPGDELVYVYSPDSGIPTAKIAFKDGNMQTIISSFDTGSDIDQYKTILDVAAGDLDGDGISEVVLAYRGGQDTDNVSLLVYDVEGTLLASQTLLNGSVNEFGGIVIAGNVIPEPMTLTLTIIGAGFLWRPASRRRQ